MSDKPSQRWKSRSRPGTARRFVAVDFDSRQVRIVQAERVGAGVRIVRILARAAPEGMDLADARAVGGLLRSALQEGRLAGWPLVMCVPRGMAVLKTLSFPPGTQEGELAGMVHYQVEKELPFRPEEAVVDFTAESHFDAGAPSGDSGAIRVLVAAIRVPVVDYYRQIAQAAGARLLRLGLRPYANQRCLGACMAGASQERCALVHLTADETEIDVIAGQALAFSRSALGKVPDAQKATEEELAEASAGVVTEVVRSLQSHQSVEGGGKVDKVYLAGGTGLEARVAKELSERLGVRCVPLNPAETMRLGGVGGGGSEFVTALGLAVGHVAAPLDFLAPKRPAAPRNVRRTRALLGSAAAIAVVLASVALGSTYLSGKKARVQSLQADYRRLEARKKGMDANAVRVASIEDWQKSGQEWLDHFSLLSALFPSAQEAYASGIIGNPDGTLRFTLHAANEQAVTEITKQLDEAGYVASAGRQSKTNDPKYPHSAEMQVRAGPGMVVDLDVLAAVPRPEDDLGAGEALPRPRPPQPASPNPAGGQGGLRTLGPTGGGNPAGGGNPQGQPRNPGGGNPQGGQGGGRGFVPPGNPTYNPNQPSGERDPNRTRRLGGVRGGRG